MKLTMITTYAYLFLTFFIPLIYIISYLRKKKRKKKYLKMFLIALILFGILFSIKYIPNKEINCYLNNKCEERIVKPTMKETTTTTTTSTTIITTTTTTTTRISSTTTTKRIKNYEKVSQITGSKVDKGKTTKGFQIYEINGVTYVDGYLIANKTYSLPENYVPIDTYQKADGSSTRQCANCINNTAFSAWKDMKADAQAVGLNIYISSGFRSYITQRNIYNRNVAKNGQANADTYSARPGSSEHQTALCFDLNTIDSSFANTKEGKWVDQNAWKYGYIIRYPKNKTNETGYIYEPWHLRYVGKELATILYNNGNWLTMEDYFGIKSSYSD